MNDALLAAAMLSVVGCGSGRTPVTPEGFSGAGTGGDVTGAGGGSGAGAAAIVPMGYAYANPLEGGQVFAVARGGGSPVLLAAGGRDHNYGDAWAFDTRAAYFTDAVWSDGVGSPLIGAVLSVPLAGGTPVTLASGLPSVYGLAVDRQNVYFVAGVRGHAASSFVGSVPIGGGAIQRLVELSGDHEEPDGIAVGNGYVYWTEAWGQVRRVPTGGGAPETIATNQNYPIAIAVDAKGVAWINNGSPGIDTPPDDGSVGYLGAGETTPRVLASSVVAAGSLGMRDGSVFWTAVVQDRGALLELQPGSSAPTILFSGAGPSNLFVDASTVYFTVTSNLETDALSPMTLVPQGP